MTYGDAAFDRDEEAAEWHLRLSEGPLDAAEQQAFDRWMRDSDNAAALQDQADLWDLTEQASATAEADRARAEALEVYRRAKTKGWSFDRQMPWRRLAAACMAAALAIGAIWTGLAYSRPDDFRTKIGVRQVAMLDDGSRLTLDADSEVTVRLKAERRALSLERGRAKFDVAHDPERPFVVSVGDRRVIATGTAFSVERLATEVRIILYEGRVAIIAPGLSNIPSELRVPGSALTLPLAASGRAAAQTVSVAQSLDWEHDQFDFKGEPLGSAVERINRYARTPIRLAGTDIGSLGVTGVFNVGETESFVEGVATFHGLTVRREPGEILLQKR